jgi:hypothetical protein
MSAKLGGLSFACEWSVTAAESAAAEVQASQARCRPPTDVCHRLGDESPRGKRQQRRVPGSRGITRVRSRFTHFATTEQSAPELTRSVSGRGGLTVIQKAHLSHLFGVEGHCFTHRMGWAGGGRDARVGPRQRSDLKRMTNIVLVYGERPVSSDAGSLLVRMAATAAIMRKPATKPMLIQVRRLSSSSAIGTAKVQSITVAFDHTRRC